MKSKITREFLEKIPKTDLHLHLDGSLRLNTLIELAKAAKVPLPSETESGLKELVFKEKYQDLPDYLRGFGLTCAVLQTPENLERVAYELAVDSMAENVRYIEVRYAPQLHIRPGFTVEEVIECVNRGLARAQQEHNTTAAVKDGSDIPFHYGIITCAMRFFNRHMSAYYAQLFDVLPHTPAKEVMAIASLEMARAAARLAHAKGIPVVGFDLAGAEAGFPAIDHKEAYQYAHVHFLKKTVHAGEAYGPESIFQAITECHADRIGHGTFLFAADKIKDPAIRIHSITCAASWTMWPRGASRSRCAQPATCKPFQPSPPWPSTRCARCWKPVCPSRFARITGWSPKPASRASWSWCAASCRSRRLNCATSFWPVSRGRSSPGRIAKNARWCARSSIATKRWKNST